ncbi:Uncharacterised protein [Chlamydia trachomatis]|nr:Uncharacterised protein [Chlamydia trachomatis]
MTCLRQKRWLVIVSAKIDEVIRLTKHSLNKNNEIDEDHEEIMKNQENSIIIVRLGL